MLASWRKVDEALFAAVFAGNDGARYHLLVEQLPDSAGWDWTVWRPGDAPEAARHGVASTADDAMRATQTEVQHWDLGTASCS